MSHDLTMSKMCAVPQLVSAPLKVPCHEDIAVSGQFCTKVITWCLYSSTKCSCKVLKETSNKFHQGTVTLILFGDFCSIALKLEKVGPIFSPLSMSILTRSVATEDRKHFQFLYIILNNKTAPLFL